MKEYLAATSKTRDGTAAGSGEGNAGTENPGRGAERGARAAGGEKGARAVDPDCAVEPACAVDPGAAGRHPGLAPRIRGRNETLPASAAGLHKVNGARMPAAPRGLRVKAALGDRLRFVRAFLKSPASVGAISPSSAALARAIVRSCDLENCDTVVELGPGTGAFTGLILSRIGQATTFFALELDRDLARSLERRFSSLIVYNDSAERLASYLSTHGKSKADLIVSGLPWASLPLSVQDRIFEAVLDSLQPGGIFATFGYVHARWFPNAKRFRRRLEAHFGEVQTSRVVWQNFPPAFIYRCVR